MKTPRKTRPAFPTMPNSQACDAKDAEGCRYRSTEGFCDAAPLTFQGCLSRPDKIVGHQHQHGRVVIQREDAAATPDLSSAATKSPPKWFEDSYPLWEGTAGGFHEAWRSITGAYSDIDQSTCPRHFCEGWSFYFDERNHLIEAKMTNGGSGYAILGVPIPADTDEDLPPLEQTDQECAEDGPVEDGPVDRPKGQAIIPIVAETAPHLPVIIERRWDSDRRITVDVTAEMRARAAQTCAYLAAGFVTQCEALARLKDEGLYVALGHESFDSWVQADFELGRTRAYQMVAVAHRLDKNVIEALTTGGKSVTKLIALAALPDEELKRLNTDGRLQLSDGREATVQDLKSMPATQVDVEVTALKKQLREEQRKAKEAQLVIDELKASHGKELAESNQYAEALKRDISILELKLQQNGGPGRAVLSAADQQLASMKKELEQLKQRLAAVAAERDELAEEAKARLQKEEDDKRVLAIVSESGKNAVAALKQFSLFMQEPDVAIDIVSEISSQVGALSTYLNNVQSLIAERLGPEF